MKLTPRVASEVSGRLTGIDPAVSQFFGLDEVRMSGRDVEDLACALWMVGYGAAISDILELPGCMPDLTPLMEVWGWEDTDDA